MKKLKGMLCVLLLFVLAGCSLARPEAGSAAGDPFVGFYAVRYSEEELDGFYDNPNLVEYGASVLKAEGYGSFSVPRKVLFAVEEGGEYVFPGLEGYKLFLLSGTMEGGGYYSKAVSDMGPGETLVNVSDEGTSEIISGTLYVGPPLGVEDWDAYQDDSIWMMYRVLQAPDGRPYLDGSGNSSSGFMGSYKETQRYASSRNGKVAGEDSIEVTVMMEAVPRLERLVVTEFDERNDAVRVENLNLEELPEIHCEVETAWVLVEEYSAEGVVRTAYNVPGPEEEAISHRVVLLDDEGLGHLEWLEIS